MPSSVRNRVVTVTGSAELTSCEEQYRGTQPSIRAPPRATALGIDSPDCQASVRRREQLLWALTHLEGPQTTALRNTVNIGTSRTYVINLVQGSHRHMDRHFAPTHEAKHSNSIPSCWSATAESSLSQVTW